MQSKLAPGSRFPDYELPDHESTPRRLSEIQGGDPMILTLASRALAGPARGHARDPARLGPRHAGPARGLGRRRPLTLPRLEQAGCSGRARAKRARRRATDHSHEFRAFAVNVSPSIVIVAVSRAPLTQGA